MAIIKEANGTYTVSFSTFDLITKKRKRTKKRGFATYREAVSFDKHHKEGVAGATFLEMFEEALDVSEANDNTKQLKRRIVANYLDSISSLSFSEITKPILLKKRAEVVNSPISASLKNQILNIIKQTFRYANEVYDLDDLAHIIKPVRKEIRKKYVVWSPDQFFKFEEVIKEKRPDLVAFFHTIYFTGIRRGEARALKPDDLDIVNKRLRIDESMRRDPSTIKAPKTANSNRWVRLDDVTFELLEPLKNNHRWLFGDYKPLANTTIARWLNKGAELAGVPYLTVHDLRHSHASYLLQQGADIVGVSSRLGHRSPNTTLQTYAHLLNDSEKNINEILNKTKGGVYE